MLINIKVEVTIDEYKYTRNTYEDIENMEEYDLERIVKRLCDDIICDVYWSKVLIELIKGKKQEERR